MDCRARPGFQPPKCSILDVLYRVHYDLLYHIALQSTASPADAEDLVQESFLRVHRRLLEHPDIEVRAAYLISALKNAARSRGRRATSDRRAMGAFAHAHTGRELLDDPERTRRQRAAAAALDEAIAALPDRCREAFARVRIEGLCPEEVAERMGISRNTLKEQLRAARLRIRDSLQAREICSLEDL